MKNLLDEKFIDIINKISHIIDSGIGDTTELENIIKNKVDKVEGKGLSTEDFTTEFKNKLDRLQNYNDTELRNKINTLTNNFNTLLDSNPDKAINSFNEIIDFLNSIEDDTTLAGIISGLETQISDVQKNLISIIDDYNGLINQRIIDNYESITNLNNNKVDKIVGKSLSTNDFTNELKDKLENDFVVIDELNFGNIIDSINDDGLNSSEISTEIATNIINKIHDAVENNKVVKITMQDGTFIASNIVWYESNICEFSIVVDSCLIWFNIVDNQCTCISYDIALINKTNKKVDKVEGKQLSTNDYTAEDKEKLDALPTAEQYTSAIDNLYDSKANKTETYTKEEVNALGNQLKAIAEARLPINSFNAWSENVPDAELTTEEIEAILTL